MKFYAHSGELSDRSDWQLLPDHLDSTARLAAERGERLGLAAAAALAGRYHDFGKYDPAFDRVLTGGNDRVDHSTAGAALLHARASGAMRLVADVISRGGVDRNILSAVIQAGRRRRPLRGGVDRNRVKPKPDVGRRVGVL